MSWLRRAPIVILLLAIGSGAHAQDRQVFFGMLHSHTSLSDGKGMPEAAYDSAREAGLHFFALTEHNHGEAAGSDGVFLTPTNYAQLRQVADDKTEDGQFVAIYGQEVSTISKGNHQNVFFAPEIINMPNGDFRFLYEHWMPDHPDAVAIQLNHPNTGNKALTIDYGIDDYDESFSDLVNACDQYVALIEVVKGTIESTATDAPHVNGQYEDPYFFYLNQGFHVAPSVGGDEHKETWGKTMKARVGIWATELTRSGLEEAIRGRHCYATEDDNISVQLRIGEQIMGDAVALTGVEAVTVTVAFQDPDEAGAKHRVQLFYDDAIDGDRAKQVANLLLDAGVSETSLPVDAEPGGYLFAKVVQLTPEDGGVHADDTWTAPIWFVEAGMPLIAAAPMPAPTSEGAPAEISWEAAAEHVGETVKVRGKIVRVHNHEDRILFMNFSPEFRETLSLVIFRDHFEHFDPLVGADAIGERVLGKDVEVVGKITMFRNTQPQIVIRSPDQIISVEGE